jgi:serine/threonine protein kinase
MSSYPDFREQGYQVIKELGRNREGGRITWLATNLHTEQQEVLKQFCFAQTGSDWSAFSAHEREIQVLKGLNHPGIPHYLNSFTTNDGFCLVQEYINAASLAKYRSLTPEEVKQIGIEVLEILVYLQNCTPNIIHRDIKPENILVDEKLNVYLIDFGFARIGSQEVAGSSVFKGTPGFIPPEQMFKPTTATDLYALGATLICLFTGIKSTEIQKLQDEDDPYLIKFHHLLPKLNLRFIGWLEKMVEPRQKDRFMNAKLALEEVKKLDLVRLPGVDFSVSSLDCKFHRLGDSFSQIITVENLIPDTILEGKWEVAPHPQDPPHTPDFHTWISVTPAKFRGNHNQFIVVVYTNKLMADKQYKRQLILHSNAYPASHTLAVNVQTAALPIEKQKIHYVDLITLFLVAEAVAIAWTYVFYTDNMVFNLFLKHLISDYGVKIGLIINIPLSLYQAISQMLTIKLANKSVIGNVIFVILAAMVNFMPHPIILLFIAFMLWFIVKYFGIFMALFAALFTCLFAFWFYVDVILPIIRRNLYASLDLKKGLFSALLILLTLGFGASLGTAIIAGFFKPLILLAPTVTGLPMLLMLLYPPLKRRRLIAKYRQSEEYLIKP